jgi:hypothetical protein
MIGIAAFAVSGCELSHDELNTRCKNWSDQYHEQEEAIKVCSQVSRCVVQMKEIKAMQWYKEQADYYCKRAEYANR